MNSSNRSRFNHAISADGIEGERDEAPTNEASAQAYAIAEVQPGDVAAELEVSSQRDGANTTPPGAEEDTSSTDVQSFARLPVCGRATAESESISAGEMPANPAGELPTEGRKIKIIEPSTAMGRTRLPVARGPLSVAAQNEAKVAASNGHPWLVAQAHIDSPKSSKYGISLAAGLEQLGHGHLHRGDLVQVEIGRGDTCYRITGRASRKAAAYFAKADLAEAGVELHTPFHFVMLGVVSQADVEGGQV